jgi:methylphosphotriester-DNA--protein-cysteine methyltransferase
VDSDGRLKVLAREPPAAQSTRRVLVESLGMTVVDFDCHAHVATADGVEEPNPTHSIVLVRRGVFRRTRQRETVIADANHVLLFNAAEPYRYAHPLPGGDASTILTVATPRALELVGRYAPAEAEDPERPFLRGHGLSSQRAMWLHWELLHLMERQASLLAVEDAMSDLASEAVGCIYHPGIPSRCGSPSARRRRRDLVEAAKLMINGRLDTLPSLTELAGALGCSPFHLSHAFHSSAGVSLRRYVGRLRARIAAERLAAGAKSLTALAFDLGYADHSHFTNSFRRVWGVSPSIFRSRYRILSGSHHRRGETPSD